MIGKDGSWLVQFSVGGKKDTITTNELETFTVIEKVGNVLPVFELVFKTQNKQLIPLLNEGNSIGLSMGKTTNKMNSSKLRQTSFQIDTRAHEDYSIKLTGAYDALKFNAGQTVKGFKQKKSSEVITEILSKYFQADPKFTNSVSSTNDLMNWVQCNVTDKRFVDEVFIHSYINGTTFPSIGITWDGSYRFADMKKVFSTSSPTRILNNDNSGGKDITYSSLNLSNSSGFINSWVGLGRSVPQFDIDIGAYEKITADVVPSLVDKISRNFTASKSFEYTIKNKNVHTNYWKAYTQNILYSMLYSSNKVVVTTTNKWYDINVLDLVNLILPEINSPQSNEQFSGKYIVTKVSRTIKDDKYMMGIELHREGFNSPKGVLV